MLNISQCPVSTLPNSWCPGMRCLAGNTTSDFYTFLETPAAVRFTDSWWQDSRIRVPARWVSFLCQAQVNTPPAEVDSWSPPSLHSLWALSPVCPRRLQVTITSTLLLTAILLLFLCSCAVRLSWEHFSFYLVCQGKQNLDARLINILKHFMDQERTDLEN